MSARATSAASPQLAPAFRLVRQLLTERPRTFQQILRDGLATRSATSEAGPSRTASVPSSGTGNAARKQVKGRKEALQDMNENIVPEGHPFVSANFLKKRILPVLASQDLIAKSTKATGTNRVGSYTWSLEPTAAQSAATTDPGADSDAPSTLTHSLPMWDRQAHWDRLLASENPSTVAFEYAQYRAELRSARRTAALDDPLKRNARRTEREIWAWDGRQEGITTNLEKVHMNTRRRAARPAKERRSAARDLEAAQRVADAVERYMRGVAAGTPSAASGTMASSAFPPSVGGA